jgi:DHA2 family methylenomycin A resistance protein-like MFS transporter
MPLLGVIAVTSYLGGKMTSVMGPKLPMMIGIIIGAVGFLALLIVRENTPYSMLILPLVAIGFGVAFTMPAATVAAIHSAPEGRAGIASGALNASRQIGSLMGVAIFGTIINQAPHFIFGMHSTLLIGGIIFLLGCMAVFLWVKKE